jgi:hypothetical protein
LVEPKNYGLGNSFDLYMFRLTAILNLKIRSYYLIKIKILIHHELLDDIKSRPIHQVRNQQLVNSLPINFLPVIPIAFIFNFTPGKFRC